MGQSTEELTSQIEETRQRMASDLDTLQDRVSPSAIVERRKEAARSRLASVKDKVMGTAQDVRGSVGSSASTANGGVSDGIQGSPLAAGLVAFGAGLVVAALLPASKVEAEAAHRVVETAKEQAQPLLDEAKAAGQDIAGGLQDSATQAAQQIKDSAQASVETVRDQGGASAETVRDQAAGS